MGKHMEIAAGLFKSKCLQLMDRVAERHETITITKRGKPVACLTPVEPPRKRALFGYLAGKARITGDIIGATGEKWEASQ